MSAEARERALMLLGGFMVTQALGWVTRLGIADLVHERPRPVTELAEATGVDADALRRVLRLLASLGVFALGDGLVRQTELSDLLRPGAAGTVRWQAELFSGIQYQAWAHAHETLGAREAAFARAHGLPFFEWLAEHAHEGEVFNRAMSASTVARRAVLLGQDWSDVTTVVDVGGGVGTLAASLLAEHEHLRGVVFDLPGLQDAAAATIAAAGLGDRCSFVGGSFFEEIPRGADAYVLSHILHDWDDDRATAILRVCREAVADSSRLLLVEAVIRDDGEPDWGTFLDVHMLVVLGGRERTEEDWRALLRAGGFRLRSVASGLGAAVLEATPE
jgi:hypothetical protein